ncbi:MAG TPA: lamin tail domain-containing protein, partial [Schlesneria sp.]
MHKHKVSRRRGLITKPREFKRNKPALSQVVGAEYVEALERRTLLAAAPVITEFEASNSSGIVDGNGAHSDWIEIQNQGDTSIDLQGWHLTDDASKPAKWTFPSHVLNAGQYMVVFASGHNTPDPAGNLHTNFALSADGENLSLREPDGTVVSEFDSDGAPYPKQIADVSYGPTKTLDSTPLIQKGAAAKAFVPVDSSLDGGQWTAVDYVDSAWKSGNTGVGFDGGGTSSTAALLGRWSAQSLNSLADGAAISSWSVAAGSGMATQTTPANQPHLEKNQLNGRSVVHFDGVNDQLRVTNQSLNGATNFTVAMVFRTSTAGRAGTQWYNNTGIVDAEVGGVTNDWGM